jgi:hypothetical protein
MAEKTKRYVHQTKHDVKVWTRRNGETVQDTIPKGTPCAELFAEYGVSYFETPDRRRFWSHTNEHTEARR